MLFFLCFIAWVLFTKFWLLYISSFRPRLDTSSILWQWGFLIVTYGVLLTISLDFWGLRELERPGLYYRVLYAILLLFTMLAMQSMLSVFTGFGKIVELVIRVFNNSMQFIVYFLLWQTIQTAIFMIMGVEIDISEQKFMLQNCD